MIENSMFYINFEVSSDSQKRCVEEIKRIGLDDIMNPIYLLKKPIIDKKADYDYQDAFVVLMPRHKMIFINFGEEGELFEEFQDDFIDDIGYIAKKYDFINIVGRPRQWREEFVSKIQYSPEEFSFQNILKCSDSIKMLAILWSKCL